MKLIKASIIILFFLCLFGCSNSKKEENYFKDQNYKSVVVEKYQDWDKHGLELVRIYNFNKDTIDIYLDNWRCDNIWDYVQVGDSLIKPLNHLAITIKREGEPLRKFRYLGVGYSL